MIRKLSWLIPVFALSLMLILGLGYVQAQKLVLYDDFSDPLIDPNKWASGQGGSRLMESVRLIQDNQLRLDARTYGETTSDIGSLFNVQYMNFINPNAITTIQSTLTVTDASATACRTNPTGLVLAQAGIGGAFFNAGTPTPGSARDDVIANLFLWRGPTDPRLVHPRFAVYRCADDSCGTQISLGEGNIGTVMMAEPVTRSYPLCGFPL